MGVIDRSAEGGETFDEGRALGGEARDRGLTGEARDRGLPGEARDRGLTGDARDQALAGEARDQALARQARDRALAGEARDRALAGQARDRALAREARDHALAGGTQGTAKGEAKDEAKGGSQQDETHVTAAQDVAVTCRGVLDANWLAGVRADGVHFGYTSPSPDHYPWQWYWDSCFSAIARRSFDRERARIELESLLAAADPEGFIGHTIFWNTPLRGIRRFTYNVTEPDAAMTSSIQPPLLAWAWSLAVGDPREEPRIVAHHDWLEHHRELDGDGLIWIVQPDESGLDASPQFDPIWRFQTHATPGFVRLVRQNRRLGYDLSRIVASGAPVVCETMTNVLYSLSRTALGRPSLTSALIERLYDPEAALFRPLARPHTNKRIPVTFAGLSPLALPDLPDEIGHRMIERHLLNPERFWLPAGIPSVAADDPSFSRSDRGHWFANRYWRGPVWINACWLLWLGMRRLGYTEEAAELTRRLVRTMASSGVHEYYDPYDATGMGQHQFAWSTLILEMIDAG